MARITVEDCLKRIPNRFELIMVAARRARQLDEGDPSALIPENDKPTVLALREIAEGYVNASILENNANRKSTTTPIVNSNDLGESDEAI